MQKWKHPVDIIKILQQNLLNIATEPTFWKCFMKTVLSRGYSETLYFNSSYWSNCCTSFQEQCIAFFMKNIVAIIFFKITTYRGLDFITVFVKYYSMDQTTLWGGPGPGV